MNAVPFDTLKRARDLRDNAGMSQAHAEGMVRAFAAAFDGEVATRADIADVRAEIRALDAKMDKRFAEMEASIDRRFAAVDLRFAKIEADLVALEHRMTIKLGGMMIVAVGAVAALVKLV